MAVDSLRAEIFRRISRGLIQFNHLFFGRPLLPERDALAVAVALEPEIVREAKAYHVQVELAGHHTRGQTALDWHRLTGHEPNVKLAPNVDMERLRGLMQAAVR